MTNFPNIYCSIPPAVNQYADIVDDHTLKWAKKFNLVPDENNFERLIKSKFGWLVSRAYPTASLEELKVVTDWNTWLFIRDDDCDESGLGKDPIRLSDMQAEFLKILEGRVPEKYDPALAHALYDIRSRLKRISNGAWMRRFTHCVSEHFESCIWEAQNRSDGITPDTETYILMRPYTGGLYTVIEMIEITENINLPFHVRKNEILQRLALMASNVVCWSNDIISFAKENKHHDVHNLVATLLPSQQSLQKAIELAADMTNTEIRAFLELETKLPSFSAKIDKDVLKYVEVLRAWMRGNLDWSYESGRYVVEMEDRTLELAL